MSHARTDRRRIWIGACVLLLVTAVAFVLRTVELDAFPPSPDDGNYLYSAGAQRIGAGDLGGWLDADLAWMRQAKTYPHSYLHQWWIRWMQRAGAANVASVRIDSAILGALTPLVLFFFARRVAPSRKLTAWLACAIVAVLAMHTWYSRSGWGQAGCTFFWLLYVWCGFELFHGAAPRGALRSLLLGLGLAGSALFAYGYHEMVVVLVVGLGIYALVHLVCERREPHARERWRALAIFVASCVPIGAYAVALPQTKFASRHWLGLVPENSNVGYWSYRGEILAAFAENRLDLEIGWLVLALAVAGAVVMRRRDARAFRFLGVIFTTSWAIFFFFFRDPFLVRIYLPAFVVLVLFAGVGLAALHERLVRNSPLVAHGAVALVLAFTLAQCAMTVLGEPGTPLAISSFYGSRQPYRHHMRPIVEHLREHRKAGEREAVTDLYTPYFELEDAGIPSLLFVGRRREPADGWPEWMIGRVKDDEGGELKDVGGRGKYELAVADTLGTLGLFRRRR
jgi:4-amino-4-deoxy-L-arabinose transferase-like glycosyltransferase